MLGKRHVIQLLQIMYKISNLIHVQHKLVMKSLVFLHTDLDNKWPYCLTRFLKEHINGTPCRFWLILFLLSSKLKKNPLQNQPQYLFHTNIQYNKKKHMCIWESPSCYDCSSAARQMEKLSLQAYGVRSYLVSSVMVTGDFWGKAFLVWSKLAVRKKFWC